MRKNCDESHNQIVLAITLTNCKLFELDDLLPVIAPERRLLPCDMVGGQLRHLHSQFHSADSSKFKNLCYSVRGSVLIDNLSSYYSRDD